MNDKTIYRIIDGKDENRRLDKRYVLLGMFIFMMVATFSFLLTRNMSNTYAAVDLSEFKAGNIMSDAVMRNYTSMTEVEIQTFLNNHNKCNRTYEASKKASYKLAGDAVNYYSESAPYTWHVTNTTKGKFVCINNEKINGETAAHIIYEAAQDYKINPQVLIVLLEKEQGLITDTYPHSVQYRSATGYGCPDNAKCNEKYYGLKNQIRNAAALFNTVLSGGWTNYPIGWNTIRYSPNSSCGSSKVYVENLATSALYRYTPYQPNAAAIKAGTGSASCGAYGNRNFYIYFTQWFGSTQKVQYTFAQNYYNQHKSTTGAIKNETVCKTKAGAAADTTKDGYYYCYQDFVNGTLFWETEIKNNVKTETNPNFQNTATATIVKTLTPAQLEKYGKVNGSSSTKNDDGTTSYYLDTEKAFLLVKGGKLEEVENPVYAYWVKVKDVIGNQTSALTTYKNDASLKIMTTENGVMLGNNEIGYYGIKKKAFAVWEQNRASLGLPTADTVVDTKTKLETQAFKNGYIIGNDAKGFYTSTGKSREAWLRNNGVNGILGFPTSEIKSNAKTGMRWQNYEGGLIVGNDSNGWYISYGKSRAVWQRKGFESGVLGWPKSDIKCNNKTGMCWQNYTKGKVVGNDKKGWYESRGSIRTKWQRSNFESGRYGFPKSDISGGRQKYEGGYIYQ